MNSLLPIACIVCLAMAMASLPQAAQAHSSSQAMELLGGSKGTNASCLSHWCASEAKSCFENWTCDEAMLCSAKCMLEWNSDPTKGKYHAQNCTTKCAASYGNDKYDAFMGCAMKHHCVSFPKIDTHCTQPTPDPSLALSDMAGEWWQHWGHNPLWDCYPCQHIHSMKAVNTSTWAYTWSYDVYYENNTLDLIGSTWDLPLAPRGEPIAFQYWYLGTAHNETWTLLGGNPERYLLVYVCSLMDAWTNVGSIVWVRPGVELTEAEVADVAATYQAKLGHLGGWDFPQDFCLDRHGPAQCPPPQ